MKYRMTDIQLAGTKAKDAIALLDLLNEHCHKHIKVKFTLAIQGHAHTDDSFFTLPKHALDKVSAYLEYYVIHEFTHCLGYWQHDASFKRKERQLLGLFGLEIEYARAYPRALYANGEQVYRKVK